MVFINKNFPLCIDLDGTLLKTDTLYETFFLLLKKKPLLIFSCLVWLFKSKAILKDEISRRVELDVANSVFVKDVEINCDLCSL